MNVTSCRTSVSMLMRETYAAWYFRLSKVLWLLFCHLRTQTFIFTPVNYQLDVIKCIKTFEKIVTFNTQINFDKNLMIKLTWYEFGRWIYFCKFLRDKKIAGNGFIILMAEIKDEIIGVDCSDRKLITEPIMVRN